MSTQPVGRPPLPAAERRTKGVHVRLNAAELETLRAAAAKREVDLCTWMRLTMIRLAEASLRR